MKTTTKMNYLDSGYELTEMTYEDQAFSFESLSSGGIGSKKYNVIKFDIPQSTNYQDLSLYYLVGEHSMSIIYAVLTAIAGITVDSTNINTILASILSNSSEVNGLYTFFRDLVSVTEKFYYSFTNTNFSSNFYEVNRFIGNLREPAGTDLNCRILLNNIDDESILPTSSGRTLADWKTITITLENYKANDADDIYNQEAA